MANLEHVKVFQQGVKVWNRWRRENPSIQPQFYGADLREFYYSSLSRVDLSNADLGEAHLSELPLYAANLTGAQLRNADLSLADLRSARLNRADLGGTDLTEADLSGANLQGANLDGATLSGARFSRANLRSAYLVSVGLAGVSLNRANLRDANLGRADLYEAQLHKANLQGANLAGARLRRSNLSEADLHKAHCTGADISEANLIGANLDEAILTNAWLWETQRTGWSIQGILCEAVYWDKEKKERTTYAPGEFERLHADKTKIILWYEGGISAVEVATLPALIQQIEATHPGCVLRLQSIQEDAGGAKVILVVENASIRNPDDLRALKADMETITQRAIRAQRALLEERRIREQIEFKLQMVFDEIFPRMMRSIMEKSQSISINVSGGTIHGNIVGDVSGENAQVNYTHNDLAAIEALVSEINTHRAELPLTTQERTQLDEKLNAILEQLATQAPNHSLLREGLHTVRHILEAGVAHVLVGQWLPLLHKLG